MIKVLAICGNGMGASTMMKLKAKGILDKYKIKSRCENCSINQAKLLVPAYDIVLVSTHLAPQLNRNKKTKIIILKNAFDIKEMESRIMESIPKEQ